MSGIGLRAHVNRWRIGSVLPIGQQTGNSEVNVSTPYSPYDPSQQESGIPGAAYPTGPYPPQDGYAPYPPQNGYAPYPPQSGYAPYPPQGGYTPGGPRGYLQGGPVGFVEAITEAFRNMFNYQGRASRSAYWWFALFSAIAFIVLVILGAALKGFGLFIDVIAYIGLVLTSLPLGVRRMHDTNRSGFWLLISLIPFGGIVVLVFSLLEGTPGPNRFG
jgi:uncharacterized membrane protein YhaH (DUF805 family)